MRKEMLKLSIQLFAKDAEDELSSQTTRTEDGVEVTSETEGTKVDKVKKPTVKKDRFVAIPTAEGAELVDGPKGSAMSPSGSTPGVTTFNVGSYSGKKERNLVGEAASSQQVEGRYDPQGRFRKKVDLPIRDVNDIVSEQIKVDFKTVKPLNEDPGSTEGYRGRIMSNSGITQKNQGTQVAQKSMFRSIDEVKRDEIYYSSGQNVTMEGNDYLGAPRTGITINGEEYESSKFEDGKNRPSMLKRGNYIPRELTIQLRKTENDVIVEDFYFKVDDVSTELEHDEVETANLSAVHSRIHGNYAERVRQRIEDVAGNEALDGWSPLARAIQEPTAFLGLIKDIEETAGNTVGFAHRKLAEALSYQINRTAKDGLHIMRPITEAATVLNEGETMSDNFELIDLFHEDQLAQGSAGLIVKMFDSIPKYDSKGVFLNLKRKSFANGLSIAETNASDFRIGNFFRETINSRQVFSTIGKDYDPSSPVYISDNALISYPYDFNDFINVRGATKNYLPHERNFGLGYQYKAPNNSYNTAVNDILVSGVYDWVVNYRKQMIAALADKKYSSIKKNEVFTLNLPTVHSTTAISLWSIIVLNATPFMRRERIATLREVLDLQNAHEYPFDDFLQPLKGFWNTSPNNYNFSSIDEPLNVGRMSDDQALTWLMPEVFIPFDEISGDSFRMVAPFYMNEKNVDFRSNGTWDFNNEHASYSFPIIRAGVTTEPLLKFAEMEPKRVRLAYDMMTLPPINKGPANTAHIYKYDLTTDGILAFHETRKISIGDILSAPRQVGAYQVAPYGYATKAILEDGSLARLEKASHFAGRTSYRVKTFFATDSENPMSSPIDAHLAINQPSNALNKAGANLRQSWIANHAGDINGGSILNGIQLSLNSSYSVTGGNIGDWNVNLIEGVSLLAPFVGKDGANITSDKKEYRLVNTSNPYHLRLNQLPFILSPWDAVAYPSRSGENGVKMDPFTFAYMFNFVGFYAVDYKEEVDIRIGEIQDQSNFYIEDKWVNDTYKKNSL